MNIQEYIKSGIIESYVLGVAGPEEAAELEQMRVLHPEVNAAILDFEQELEQAARKNAIPVAGDMKDQLFKQLKLTPQMVPVAAPRKGSVTAFSKPLVAAAAVLLIVSIAYNIYAYQKVRTLERENKDLALQRSMLYAKGEMLQTRAAALDSSLQFFSDPSSLKIALTGIKETATTKAVVIWNKKNKEVRLTLKALPAPPPNKQYQLWALVNGTPVDAGVIGDCATVCVLKNIENAEAFAITLEKSGGSPAPSLDQLQAIGKIPG
ncbi:anti-sigma factor [Niabella aurantiaca]|uniref:anti-sigma factor n=1 Tax=Niabella aurantiaca TaxID=379900 RepID=UPI0003720CBF|nr:anti-sigma factor [Niabella aurantiaca]